MFQHRQWIWFVIFLVLGFAYRAFYVITLEQYHAFYGDSASYAAYAKNLLMHGMFAKGTVPDSYWAPGYPLFVAGVMALAGKIGVHYYPSVLFLQAFLGGLTVAFTYLLGRQFLSHSFAVVAALLCILSPHLEVYSGVFLTETLSCFLFVVGLWLYLVFARQQNRKWGYILAGFVWGYEYLVNPAVLFVPFFLFFLDLFVSRGNLKVEFRQRMGRVLFIGIVGLFVAGWALRSALVVPEGAPTSSERAFENLVIGSHSEYHALWQAQVPIENNPAEYELRLFKNDHGAFYRLLLDRITEQPLDYLQWYAVMKPSDLWGWDVLVGAGGIYPYEIKASLYSKSAIAFGSMVIMKHLHNILLILALVGIIFVWRERRHGHRYLLLGLYGAMIIVSGLYVLLHTDSRYTVALRPELYLCVAYCLEVVIVKWQQHRSLGDDSLAVS